MSAALALAGCALGGLAAAYNAAVGARARNASAAVGWGSSALLFALLALRVAADGAAP